MMDFFVKPTESETWCCNVFTENKDLIKQPQLCFCIPLGSVLHVEIRVRSLMMSLNISYNSKTAAVEKICHHTNALPDNYG